MTIYNESGLKIILDDDAVSIYNEGQHVITMTEAEYESIIKAYQEAKS